MNKNHLLIAGLALIVALLASLFFAGDGGASDLQLQSEEGIQESLEVTSAGSLPEADAIEVSEEAETPRDTVAVAREEIVAAETDEEVVVPTPSLRVRVEDESGQPMGGVPVLLREVYPQWSNTKTSLDTDAETGEVLFTDVTRHFRVVEDGPTWDVSLGVLIAEPSRAEIDPENLPSDVIVLQMPLTGTVEVSVLDEYWERFEEQGNVELSLVPRGERREISPFSRRKRPTLQRTSNDGKAVFEFVELGMDVQASVKRSSAIAASQAFGEGPQRPGETTQVEVRLGSDHPVARIRAVREDGMPIADTRLSLDYSARGVFTSSSRTLTARTDGDGYFLFGSDDWIEDSTRRLGVKLNDEEEGEIAGEVDLSFAMEDGINDLGDVVLTTPSVFVAGRVITASGEPVPNAALSLRVGKADGGNMRDSYTFQHKADEEGRFEIDEVTVGGSFELSAESPGQACQWFGFEPGETNLVITTSVPGSLAGSVLLDEGIPADRIEIRVEPLEDKKENLQWKDRRKFPDAKGEFLFEQLLPGTRQVRIRVQNQELTFADLDDVQVVAGEVTRDPRLQSIDLRGELWVHDIEINGFAADERPNGTLRFRPAGEEEYGRSIWLSERSFPVLSKTEFIDIMLAVPGYRAEEISGVGRDAKVQLRKGLEVTLVLVGDARIPEAPIYVKPSLAPTDGSQHSPNFGGEVLDGAREVKVRTSHTGRLKVEWLVEMRTTGSSMATSHTLEREEFVEVLDIGGGQRFEVSLTQAEMDEIVSLMDRD